MRSRCRCRMHCCSGGSVTQRLRRQVSRTVPAVTLMQGSSRPRLRQKMLISTNSHRLSSVVVGNRWLCILFGIISVRDNRNRDRGYSGFPLVTAMICHAMSSGGS